MKLTAPGWTIPENATIELGYICWYDSADHTYWMVDPETGSPWARPGAKKVVTDRDLKYSNPKATPHWFDTAKENHGDSWVRAVKKIAGGG